MGAVITPANTAKVAVATLPLINAPAERMLLATPPPFDTTGSANARAISSRL
jgi:hypothetical protein